MRAIKETVRKYYKYIDTDFVQPVLTSDGTMGGDSFAVSANAEATSWGTYAYKAFDGDNDSLWCAYTYAFTSGVWYQFYNPNPLNVTNINQYTYQGVSGYGMKSGTIYASNDGSNWITIKEVSGLSGATTDIPIATDKYYKYWRIYISGNQGANQVKINETTITAIQRTIGEGTSTDYDYYVDTNIYKLPKIDDIYYGINQ